MRTVKTVIRDGQGRIERIEERHLPDATDVAEATVALAIRKLGLPNNVPYGGHASITIDVDQLAPGAVDPAQREEIKRLLPQHLRARWPGVLNGRYSAITISYVEPGTTSAVAAERTIQPTQQPKPRRRPGFVTS